MSYAILRTKKLKEWGNICASLEHNFRERLTPNADENRTAENVHIGGNSTAEIRAKIEQGLPQKYRADCVKCVEYLITASPEWFAEHGKDDHQKYFDRSIEWLKERHGADNIKCISIHNDESTPHLVAYVVPIDERGKLNAKKWLGGKKLLNEMQSNFAERVADFGLSRGIEGSRAKHERVQRFYGNLENDRIEFSIDDIKPRLLKKGVFKDEYEDFEKAVLPRANAKLKLALDEKNKQIRHLQKQNKRLQAVQEKLVKNLKEENKNLDIAVFTREKLWKEQNSEFNALQRDFNKYKQDHRINTENLSEAQINAFKGQIEQQQAENLERERKERLKMSRSTGGMKI